MGSVAMKPASLASSAAVAGEKEEEEETTGKEGEEGKEAGNAAASTVAAARASPSIEFRNVFFSYPKHASAAATTTATTSTSPSEAETVNVLMGEKEEASGEESSSPSPTLSLPAAAAASGGLRGVSFLVEGGTSLGIVGQTGAGKTTISRLLYRFFDASSGQVLIDGEDVKGVQQQSVREVVGIVPQDTVLFNASILHNVQYGCINAPFARVEAAARAAQILPFIESLPSKWQTVVGERGLKLSGGEKQRVAIARCLLKDPPIVIFDEATASLDTLMEREVQSALASLRCEKRTVVTIAHRLSTIRHCDQIIVLDKGRIIENGSHEELLLINNGTYAKMWACQDLGGVIMRGDVGEKEGSKGEDTHDDQRLEPI